MEQQHAPEVVVALYDRLAEAEAAMDELEDVGVPYPDIRMGAHTSADPDLPALGAAALPEQFWSLKVVIDQRGVYHAEDILRKHQPLAVGRMPAPLAGRSACPPGFRQVPETSGERGGAGVAPPSPAQPTAAAATTPTISATRQRAFMPAIPCRPGGRL